MPRSVAPLFDARARFELWIWLAAFLVCGVLAPAAALAQVPDTVPEPPDAPAPDTLLVPIPPEEVAADTMPTAVQEAAEVEVPLPDIVRFPDTRPVGWYAGRWSWTRRELALVPGMTLLDFLEFIPGITRFRPGGFGRPTGLAALGFGGGRVRVLVDGFELDPLHTGAYPLETLALLDINSIRVERTLSEIRVEVETFRLQDPEPYSVVELGTGATQNRLLRALFSRPIGGRSIVTGAFDIVSTGGIGLREDYSHSNAAFRWNYVVDDATALDVEWRRSALDRAGEIFPQEWTRSDFVVRARRRLAPGLTVEGILGRTAAEEEVDPLLPDALRATQAALRFGFARERFAVEGVGRYRKVGQDRSTVPVSEGEIRALLRPTPSLRIEGEGRIGQAENATASEARALATFSPIPGLSLFGSVNAGNRLTRYIDVREFEIPGEEEGELETVDLQVDSLMAAEVAGWRAGAEVGGRLGTLGVAAFHAGATDAVPFGLPFDREAPIVTAGAGLGAEAYVTVPVPGTGGALRLEGWYSRFAEAEQRIYTPASIGRGAIVFNRAYYEGQLEPAIRLEAVHRGSARVPSGPGGEFDASTQPSQTFNFTLNLRIIDVRAFLLWENVLNTDTATDFPWGPPAFPRIVYGASWQFTN